MSRNLRNDSRKFTPPPLPQHTMVFNGSWYQCRECGQVYLMAGRSRDRAAMLHEMHKAEAKAWRSGDREDNVLHDGEAG